MHFKTLWGPGCPFKLQSWCLCGPLSSPCQVWASPPRGAQECLFNESLGALHPSPHPEPFFRVTVKHEERGPKGVSSLSKVYVRLPETTITLLKGRRTLVSPIFRAARLGP